MTRAVAAGRSARRRRKGRRVLAVFQVVLCLGAFGGVGYAFYKYLQSSTDFFVKTVQVAGAEVLDPEKVVAQSGITAGDNVFFFDPLQIEARVAAMPRVKSCTVTRKFPDTVQITIAERPAVATLLVGSHAHAVDWEGVVLQRLGGDEVHSGPLITGVPGPGVVEAGQHLDNPLVLDALAVWRAFSATGMGQEVTVSEISVQNRSKIGMFCDEFPCEIRWRSGDVERQARKLDVLWRHLGERLDFADYVDLRFGDDVACR